MAFLAGQTLTAAALNAAFGFDANADDTQVTSGTTTSTTYTATLTGGVACSMTFVAPASGAVTITSNAQANNSGAAFCFHAPQVRTGGVIGSGTLVLTASDDEADDMNGANAFRNAIVRRLRNLTPGATYNVQQMYKVSAGTGTFTRKHLIVEPS